MNRILLETHKKKNINLLRVRDFNLNKPKKLTPNIIIFFDYPLLLIVESIMTFQIIVLMTVKSTSTGMKKYSPRRIKIMFSAVKWIILFIHIMFIGIPRKYIQFF